MTRRDDDHDNVSNIFRRKRDQTNAEEFAAAARRLQQEREVAGEIVERLLRATPRDQWRTLSERSELKTVGALERLGNTSTAPLTRDPIEAMAIAELAVATAEGLGSYAYPVPVVAQLRVHAWKDLGKALRCLGRNEEALAAFDTAEDKIEPHCVLAHDRAIVRFNRAMSLQELERFEDSREYIVSLRTAPERDFASAH
jgi:tetratricopeptide (TPR) repeat protein